MKCGKRWPSGVVLHQVRFATSIAAGHLTTAATLARSSYASTSGGTGVSGLSFGLRLCHSVAC